MGSSLVRHTGIIQNITSDELEILILSESACSSCKSKKVCSIAEVKEKEIFIKTNTDNYRIGEKVNVILMEKLGVYAVLFAYFFPFLIMISILIFGYYNKTSEPVMGISVILAIAVYFFILHLFKNQFNKKMTFTVEKQSLNNNQFSSEIDEKI